MNADILETIGFIASLIIAVSMTVSSVVRFRWINLAGAGIFAFYGLLIHSYPVAVLNGFIVLADLYYLSAIYGRKHFFETLEIEGNNPYLMRFLAFHQKDIKRFFPGFDYKPEEYTVCFFVLRNMAVAGLVLAHRNKESILHVSLDYVVPEYRDYKNGRFVYEILKQSFKQAGIKKIVAEAKTPTHVKYLKRLGFKNSGIDLMEKPIG